MNVVDGRQVGRLQLSAVNRKERASEELIYKTETDTRTQKANMFTKAGGREHIWSLGLIDTHQYQRFITATLLLLLLSRFSHVRLCATPIDGHAT